VRPDSEHRPVGPAHLLALGVNGIVGVGIFFAPADLAARAPGAGSAIFALTALALVPVALAFATLGGRFDEDGGPVVFARAAFGPLPAFVVGWIAYVSAIASSAAVTVGLTTAVGPVVGLDGQAAQRAAATILAALLALVCARGLRLSARTWTTLTALKVVPLIALALVFLASPRPPAASAGSPLPVGGPDPSWGAAALVAVFTLQGFEIVPVLAGRARRPAFSVPLATVGALVIASLLYVVLQAACVSALPNLASSRAPLVEAAGVLGGPGLAALVGAGTSVSALGIAFGMMAATPFYLAALARVDGLGMGIAAVDPRGVPSRALFVTWALVTLLIQAGGRGELFALSSIAVLTQYLVTAAALLALALRRQRGLGMRHVAVAVPAGIVALALVAGASPREAIVAGAALLVGLVIRVAMRRRAATEPA
jgi:basic amino acid/polyamine antiporter, APA family